MDIITARAAIPSVPLDTYGKRASKVTTECSTWLRKAVKITDPNKPFYSHRHTATSYLRNTRLPDGSPAVKEDIERYIQIAARRTPDEMRHPDRLFDYVVQARSAHGAALAAATTS